MNYIKAIMLIKKKFPEYKIPYIEHKQGAYWFTIQHVNPLEDRRNDRVYRLDDKTSEITVHHHGIDDI